MSDAIDSLIDEGRIFASGYTIGFAEAVLLATAEDVPLEALIASIADREYGLTSAGVTVMELMLERYGARLVVTDESDPEGLTQVKVILPKGLGAK